MDMLDIKRLREAAEKKHAHNMQFIEDLEKDMFKCDDDEDEDEDSDSCCDDTDPCCEDDDDKDNKDFDYDFQRYKLENAIKDDFEDDDNENDTLHRLVRDIGRFLLGLRPCNFQNKDCCKHKDDDND